jgi:hypothetical protein
LWKKLVKKRKKLNKLLLRSRSSKIIVDRVCSMIYLEMTSLAMETTIPLQILPSSRSLKSQKDMKILLLKARMTSTWKLASSSVQVFKNFLLKMLSMSVITTKPLHQSLYFKISLRIFTSLFRNCNQALTDAWELMLARLG